VIEAADGDKMQAIFEAGCNKRRPALLIFFSEVPVNWRHERGGNLSCSGGGGGGGGVGGCGAGGVGDTCGGIVVGRVVEERAHL
jgi:hypothetical protein